MPAQPGRLLAQQLRQQRRHLALAAALLRVLGAAGGRGLAWLFLVLKIDGAKQDIRRAEQRERNKSLSLGRELPVPLPALAALLTGGRCRPQRPWGSSSLPPYQREGRSVGRPQRKGARRRKRRKRNRIEEEQSRGRERKGGERHEQGAPTCHLPAASSASSSASASSPTGGGGWSRMRRQCPTRRSACARTAQRGRALIIFSSISLSLSFPLFPLFSFFLFFFLLFLFRIP